MATASVSKSLLAIEAKLGKRQAILLVDTCAEVSLIGASSLDKQDNVTECSTRVVGAASGYDLAIAGKVTLVVSLSTTATAKVTFIVSGSYHGHPILGWPTLRSWGLSLSPGRIAFRRWPGLSWPEAAVAASAWSEAEALRLQLKAAPEEVKEAPKTLLTEELRAKVLSTAHFRDAKAPGKWHELPRYPMAQLRQLLTGSLPCAIALKANFGSATLQALDHAISIPLVLENVGSKTNVLCLAFWLGDPASSASWRGNLARLPKKDLLNRMLTLSTSVEAKVFAEALCAYLLDCSPDADMVWDGLKEGQADDDDIPIVYPPTKEVKVPKPTPLSIADKVNCGMSVYKANVIGMLLKYHEILGEANTAKIRGYCHRIILSSDIPFKQSPRKYDAGTIAFIEQQAKELVQQGLIAQAPVGNAPYASSPLIVKKKDEHGKLTQRRLCVDFRQLNALTVKDRYNLPNLESCLHMRDAKVFSKIDLRSAFWQIPIEWNDMTKTGFDAGNKIYYWRKMAFGLTNAPASMQRLMDKCLDEALNSYATAYLDDIIIYSDTPESHLKHLEYVLRQLNKFGLRISLAKCEFFKSEIVFLGHLIKHGQISIDPSKVEGIKKMPPPTDVKSLMRVLGVFGWSRRFIMNYSSISAPLTDLLRTKAQWVWGPAQNEAFQTLKARLVESPVLVQPEFQKEFILETDASDYGIGAVLGQCDSRGKLRPVSFISRKLTSAEKNYSTREKEALAIVWSVEKLSHFLWGRKFTIITDHKSLVWMRTLLPDSGRISRWVQKLQPYDFEIKYRRGSDNKVADALSRAPVLLVRCRGNTMNVIPINPVTRVPKKRRRAKDFAHQVLIGEAKDQSLPPSLYPVQSLRDLKADPGQGCPVGPSGFQAAPVQAASLSDAKARGPVAVMAGKLPLEDDAYRIPDREVWRRYLMADPRYGSLIKYLTKQELPSDLAERERLKRAAGFHFVEDGLLYYRQSTKIGEQHVLIVPAEYREISYGYITITLCRATELPRRCET